MTKFEKGDSGKSSIEQKQEAIRKLARDLREPEEGANLKSSIVRALGLYTPRIAREEGRDHWKLGIYGKPISDYEREFGHVLSGMSVQDLLKDAEGKYRKGLVVVDLMAPTDTVANLFTKLPSDSTRRGIALSLTDERSKIREKRDKQLGITQIAGNLSELETFRTLERELKGQKADLIMERALGGLTHVPHNRLYFSFAAQRLWGMLNDNGNLIAQVPQMNTLSLEEWTYLLNDSGIEAHTATLYKTDVVRLVKHSDSPKRLPFLQ